MILVHSDSTLCKATAHLLADLRRLYLNKDQINVFISNIAKSSTNAKLVIIKPLLNATTCYISDAAEGFSIRYS